MSLSLTLRPASRYLITSGPRINLARPAARFLSTPSETPAPSPSSSKASDKKPLSSAPYKIEGTPQFPPPVNPFETKARAVASAEDYSETTKNVVKGVARLMGYNSASTTAIRETGRMMKGVVDAVEKDRDFWYSVCQLPPTYQTFFQLHLLYILILVTRLRAIRANPNAPVNTEQSGSSVSPPLQIVKPPHESYPTELLSHFFELAESQMRMVLGSSERERVVRKYMEEMGEQWKGAGTGLDYVLGLSISEDPADQARADSELASWAWRNLFASRGVTPPSPAIEPAVDELKFIEQLELVTRFVRRELSRLSQIDDGEIMAGDVGEWGVVEQ